MQNILYYNYKKYGCVVHDFKTLREGPIIMKFGYICTGEGGRGALGTVTAVTVPELRS